MAYVSKGTELRVNHEVYVRVDRYATVPKGVGVAPYLALKTRRGITTGSSSYITTQFNTSSSWVQAISIGSQEPCRGLLNQVAGRLREDVYEQMQLASNIIEGRETGKMFRDRSRKTGRSAVMAVHNAVETVARRATSLRIAYQQLRSGRLDRMLNTLGVKRASLKGRAKYLATLNRKSRNFRRETKDVGNTWLEYHFGWKPLIQDIFNAVQTLTGKIGWGKFSASVSNRVVESTFPLYYWSSSLIGRVVVKTGARFTLVNPNAFLRERAGLNNPASWLWEAIPFSFLVDWVTNVSQCLSAMTDYTGLSIDDPYTTVFAVASSRDVLESPASPVDAQFDSFQIRRSVGLVDPTLRLSLPRGLSVSRGATAIALLLQTLKT